MSISYARASRIASSCPKDFDFQYFIYQNEGEYPMWLTGERIVNWIYSLPESVVWNAIVSVMSLLCLAIVSMDLHLDKLFVLGPTIWIEGIYNVIYMLHLIANISYDCNRVKRDEMVFKCGYFVNYLADLLSFVHYPASLVEDHDIRYYVKVTCYHVRLYTTVVFLSGLMEHNLRGNVVIMLLKNIYMFILIRIIYANVFSWSGFIATPQYETLPQWLQNMRTRLFYRSFYVIDKYFLPIGPDGQPSNDVERIASLILMLSGCLLVTGTTIASLSLIMGIYMRPEEVFRLRFKIILLDMVCCILRRWYNTNLPSALQDKVETFYRMYWHKQKAVSRTDIMERFPPTLTAAINTDIYFEALQKSRILCDLSYQFLSELAKCMQTVNYVPGDLIVARKSNKSDVIYIAYGDVEMLTAEDDESPILRFTRGTIINPSGGCAIMAAATSHVGIRAATFCTAHILTASDLWRVTAKFGRANGQAFIVHSSFEEHFEKVKRHYSGRHHTSVKYKSTIMMLKRNLIELKEATDLDGNLLLAKNDVFIEIAGCYIMRNQEGTSLTEESDAICLRPTFPCILQPSSSLIIAWQTFVALLSLGVTFIHPFQLIYLKTITPSFKLFDTFVSFVYLMDIVVHLSIGTKIEEGVPITFMQTSSKQMGSLWFLVDLLSTLPMFVFVGDGRFAGANKILKLLKVFKLMKHLETVFVHHSNALRFTAYCLIMVILFYLLAVVQQGWSCFVYHKCIITNYTSAPYWTTSKLNDGPVKRRFTISLYWAVSFFTFTSHKTAAITKTSWSMQAYTLLLLEICIIFHIVLQAMFSATIMVTEHMRDQYDTCIETVKNFLVKSNVDPVLRYRFITYLKLCWYTDKAYSITHEKNSIHFDLPSHVYQDMLAQQRIKYFLCIPFMKFIHKTSMRKISAEARLFYTSPNEILQNTGDISNEIYVVRQGICEVLDPNTRKVVSLLTSKTYFGDMECLLRIPAFYTVRAATHVQVYSISRKNILEILSLPRIENTIRFAKKSPLYSQLQMRRGQFLSYEMPSKPPNREFFPLLRKHEPDVIFLQPFSRLGFFSILRYVFPRFTIRPDSKYLKRYEWFRAACAIISANLFPVYTILLLQWPALYKFSWFLDLSAYFDIFQRMLVAYYNEKGILVYHPASTAAHYMKGAFIVDILSCLPLEYLDSVRNTLYYNDNAYMIPSTGQHLMYNRLVQLYRVPNALEILNDYIERQDIILLIKSMPIFMALLIITTSLMLESSVEKWSVITGGWRLIPVRHNNISWIDDSEQKVGYNITETPFNLFLTTFYWVVYEVTTTGYNIFQPNTESVLLILISGMIVCAMMTTYFSVQVISIRSNVNQALGSFQAHMKDIKLFMNGETLDKELQKEVISYYEYKWDKTGGTDYRTVLKLCDQITLRTDTILHIYGQTFNKCPILHKCELSLQRIMGRAVYSVYYRQGMTIIERDQVSGDLFIIDYGTVEMRHSTDDTHILTKLPKGSMFGTLDNVKTAISANRFVAASNLHLLKINAVVFNKIIADFPAVKVLLMKFRPNEQNYIIGSLRDQSVVLATWRERAMSSPLIVVTREGLLKYLHVHNKSVQIYLILVSLFCIYGDLYNAGFHDNNHILIGFLYFLDVCFILKIVMNYTMPYITDEESESRIALESSRMKYFKGEFPIDLLSVLPLEAFSFMEHDTWSIFPYLRLNRLFRVITVYNCLSRYYQKLNINLTISTVFTVFIWFTLFVHATSCLWYSISRYEEKVKKYSSWQYSDAQGTSLCNRQYICSTYFILSTFTLNGVGDILPKQKSEVAFVSLLMICSTMIYMIYVGEFSNIIQYQSFRCFDFYSQYLELNEFLKNNRVSVNLVKLTMKYTLHLWRESRGYQMPYFLETAPLCLRLKVMSSAYMLHLLGHPVFQLCEPAFLRHVVGCFRPLLYCENMWVVKEGEITNAMYFIHRGRVQELDEDMEETIQEYVPGNYFGTLRGLKRNTAYALSYKTIIKSQVLTLCLDDWEYLLEHFPVSKQIIYRDEARDDLDSEKLGSHEKKKVQITKGATVHNILGQSLQSLIKLISKQSLPSVQSSRSQLEINMSKQKIESASKLQMANKELTGIPSGRDSDTAVASAKSKKRRTSEPQSLMDLRSITKAKKKEKKAATVSIELRRKSSIQDTKPLKETITSELPQKSLIEDTKPIEETTTFERRRKSSVEDRKPFEEATTSERRRKSSIQDTMPIEKTTILERPKKSLIEDTKPMKETTTLERRSISSIEDTNPIEVTTALDSHRKSSTEYTKPIEETATLESRRKFSTQDTKLVEGTATLEHRRKSSIEDRMSLEETTTLERRRTSSDADTKPIEETTTSERRRKTSTLDTKPITETATSEHRRKSSIVDSKPIKETTTTEHPRKSSIEDTKPKPIEETTTSKRRRMSSIQDTMPIEDSTALGRGRKSSIEDTMSIEKTTTLEGRRKSSAQDSKPINETEDKNIVAEASAKPEQVVKGKKESTKKSEDKQVDQTVDSGTQSISKTEQDDIIFQQKAMPEIQKQSESLVILESAEKVLTESKETNRPVKSDIIEQDVEMLGLSYDTVTQQISNQESKEEILEDTPITLMKMDKITDSTEVESKNIEELDLSFQMLSKEALNVLIDQEDKNKLPTLIEESEDKVKEEIIKSYMTLDKEESAQSVSEGKTQNIQIELLDPTVIQREDKKSFQDERSDSIPMSLLPKYVKSSSKEQFIPTKPVSSKEKNNVEHITDDKSHKIDTMIVPTKQDSPHEFKEIRDSKDEERLSSDHDLAITKSDQGKMERRKSVVHGVDKDAVAEELAAIKSSIDISITQKFQTQDSKDEPSLPVQISTSEEKTRLSTQQLENSPWPLDSRRISSQQEFDTAKPSDSPKSEDFVSKLKKVARQSSASISRIGSTLTSFGLKRPSKADTSEVPIVTSTSSMTDIKKKESSDERHSSLPSKSKELSSRVQEIKIDISSSTLAESVDSDEEEEEPKRISGEFSPKHSLKASPSSILKTTDKDKKKDKDPKQRHKSIIKRLFGTKEPDPRLSDDYEAENVLSATAKPARSMVSITFNEPVKPMDRSASNLSVLSLGSKENRSTMWFAGGRDQDSTLLVADEATTSVRKQEASETSVLGLVRGSSSKYSIMDVEDVQMARAKKKKGKKVSLADKDEASPSSSPRGSDGGPWSRKRKSS